MEISLEDETMMQFLLFSFSFCITRLRRCFSLSMKMKICESNTSDIIKYHIENDNNDRDANKSANVYI